MSATPAEIRITDIPKFSNFLTATAGLLGALAEAGPQPEPVMIAADMVRKAVADLGGRDIGPPP